MLNCFAALGLSAKNFSLSLLSPIFIYIFFLFSFRLTILFLVSSLPLSPSFSTSSSWLEFFYNYMEFTRFVPATHSRFSGSGPGQFVKPLDRFPIWKLVFMFYFGRFIFFSSFCFVFCFLVSNAIRIQRYRCQVVCTCIELVLHFVSFFLNWFTVLYQNYENIESGVVGACIKAICIRLNKIIY